MKTAEELNALKAEVEILKRKLAGLTEEELLQVNGGCGADLYTPYVEIIMAIEDGNADRAKRKFRIYYEDFSEAQIMNLRFLFKEKFGYPID